MNALQYEANQCGKCIEIRYAGKCAEAVIVDRCAGCPNGGLDISIDSFATLVGSKAEAERRGFVSGVKWTWIKCNTGCQQ